MKVIAKTNSGDLFIYEIEKPKPLDPELVLKQARTLAQCIEDDNLIVFDKLPSAVDKVIVKTVLNGVINAQLCRQWKVTL